MTSSAFPPPTQCRTLEVELCFGCFCLNLELSSCVTTTSQLCHFGVVSEHYGFAVPYVIVTAVDLLVIKTITCSDSCVDYIKDIHFFTQLSANFSHFNCHRILKYLTIVSVCVNYLKRYRMLYFYVKKHPNTINYFKGKVSHNAFLTATF